MSYFALNDVQDTLSARQAGIVTYRLPSFGSFSTSVNTQYWFGIPRDVSFPGVTMDIDYLYTQAVDESNEQADVVNFLRATGPRTSALEHLVPEQLFSTEDNPAEGISAVKALALAQMEGQRVYTLTAGNLDAALVAITASPEVESEIRHAVNSGLEVTIHQSPISHYGWQGHGYIIIDPETGAGAYKIESGANGSETDDESDDLQWADILAFFEGLADLSNNKWLNGIGKILGKINGALQALSIAQNCPENAQTISAVYTIGSMAWAAYTSAWFLLAGFWMAFAVLVVGIILFSIMLAADLHQCKINRGE